MTNIDTFDGPAWALANVLKNWRISKNITIYQIAKFENCRIEVLQNVENAVANMVGLVKYLDFIRCKDRKFLDVIMEKWCKELGHE